MSKSKHSAQASLSPAPTAKPNLLKNASGGVHAGWLLALSLAAYAAVSPVLRAALAAAFAALFRAWGVDAQSVARAPGWARWLYAWHGSLVTALAAAAALLLSRWLRRLWALPKEKPRFSPRTFAVAALLGLGLTAMIAALCLLPDSMRPEWPLTRPRGDAALLPLCLLSLLGALAEEAFTKRVLFDGLRARWGAGWAALCAALAALLIGGMPNSALSAVNALLLALTCCGLYARRGLWAAAGFRWGWSLANVFLLGFGGGSHAVYRLYGVSEALLTGGDTGLIGGLWATLALAVLAAWPYRHKIKGILRIKRPSQNE